jgi:hypothetical protein
MEIWCFDLAHRDKESEKVDEPTHQEGQSDVGKMISSKHNFPGGLPMRPSQSDFLFSTKIDMTWKFGACRLQYY